MPPFRISVDVYEDIPHVTTFFQQVEALLKAIRGALLALAALVTLILGWLGWKRRSRRKANGPPADP